jgi:hypothetical protein
LNAGYLNAGYLNGGSMGGLNMGTMKTASNKPISNVRITKDYLEGDAEMYGITGWNGWTFTYGWQTRALDPDEFEGATFEATVNDASNDELVGAITVKITDVIEIAGADGTTHYQYVFKWIDAQTGDETPVCGCENAKATCTKPVPATVVQGMWNYEQGTIDGGKKISNDPNLMTMACAGGAISKCASDQATTSPLTPYYSGTVSTSTYSWVHKGAWIVYPREKITVKLTNVTGNPDLYVRWNDEPTGSTYTCRPQNAAGATETCTLTVPSYAYYAYISVYGYGSTSSTLTVTATNATPRGMGYEPYGLALCTTNIYTGVQHCNTSHSWEHQSCTRMVTADYCGDGTPHTITGRPVEVYDNFSPQVNEEDPASTAYYFESEWTPSGANSIGTCRVADMDLSDADPDECPVYGRFQHQIAHYAMNAAGTACLADQSNSGVYTNRDGYLYNYNTGTYYPRQLVRQISKGWF